MNIRIICLGKIKEKSLAELIHEYKKRISKYANFEIVELQDESIKTTPSEKDILNIKKIEADKIKNILSKSETFRLFSSQLAFLKVSTSSSSF